MGKAANLCNQKFGKLLVISRLDMKSSNGGILWSCLCDCGNLTKATTGHLRWGIGLLADVFLVQEVRNMGCTKNLNILLGTV